jgi:hypothetical protein
MTPAGWVVLGAFLVLILADVLLVKLGQRTESDQLAKWGQASTAIPYLFGFLMGHWFVNVRIPLVSAWGYGAGELILLSAWDVGWALLKCPRVWYRWAPIYLVLGMAAGALVWGQADPSSILP